jgi:hypothetical protein
MRAERRGIEPKARRRVLNDAGDNPGRQALCTNTLIAAIPDAPEQGAGVNAGGRPPCR